MVAILHLRRGGRMRTPNKLTSVCALRRRATACATRTPCGCLDQRMGGDCCWHGGAVQRNKGVWAERGGGRMGGLKLQLPARQPRCLPQGKSRQTTEASQQPLLEDSVRACPGSGMCALSAISRRCVQQDIPTRTRLTSGPEGANRRCARQQSNEPGSSRLASRACGRHAKANTRTAGRR